MPNPKVKEIKVEKNEKKTTCLGVAKITNTTVQAMFPNNIDY